MPLKVACSECGYLHRVRNAVPIGRTAKCRRCASNFKVSDAIEASEDAKYLTLDIEWDGSSETRGIGESYYRDNLDGLLRKWDADPANDFRRSVYPAEVDVICELVPETDNPHDPNAVRIECHDVQIGHLRRTDAQMHRNFLREQGRPRQSSGR